jgi:1-aminocyclopropane-1-carboxylate deaminase
LVYGRNKIRKLEYLVADAIEKGCDTLISIGGVQSNHTRQVAAVAAHVGMKAHLVPEHWVNWNEPNYDRVGNIQLSRNMEANVELNPSGFSIGIRESWQNALKKVNEQDRPRN